MKRLLQYFHYYHKSSKISSFAGFAVLIISIAILSIFFHRPIQIIDALSSSPVPGFDIHISPWRVLSEPLTGPLLFYLRADQAVKEFGILLIWLIGLSLLFTLVNRRHRFLSWLKTVPLIASVWLGLLWLIIYVPLPANTIINLEENTILVNTHSHTEYSHDGIISTSGLQKWHGKNGYDAFFLTDHNHHQQSMEAVLAQDRGELPGEPLMMVGEEYSGSNHMTLLGLKRNFITRGLSDQQVIDSTHDDQGVVIVAHWFDDERKSIPFFLDLGVDGFEIANQASGLSYDRRIFEDIKKACDSRALIMTGAADYHGYGSSCFVWNALDIPGWRQMEAGQKREAIMQVLRQRDMSRIRVLLYHDRVVFDRSRVFLSPLYNLVNYFRTLKPVQVLSWLLWLVLLAILRNRLKGKAGTASRKALRIAALKIATLKIATLEIAALTSSIFLIINGILLLGKSRLLVEYNDIYSEYSSLLLWTGTGFLVYSVILILIGQRRSENFINQD